MVDDRDRDRDDRQIPPPRDTAIDGNAPTLLTPRREAPEEHATGGPTLQLGGTDRTTPAVAEPAGPRYELREVLGRGGMGEVVLAFDQQIGREVAVKRIRSEQPSDEEISRFVREARVQGRLEHPAVVPVHDLVIDRTGLPFFVMKRLAGTDLKELCERLRDGREPDEAGARRRLLRAFVDVCLAVEFAHSRGIVHRDLKPANVMLGDFGEVYVLDWGIARVLADDADASAAPAPAAPAVDPAVEPTLPAPPLSPAATPSGEHARDDWQTRPGAILGTPAYMAPEQLAGEPAGPASDVYALGCILRELTAGTPELEALAVRATAGDRAERLGSARALGTAVQAFLDGDRDVAARKELARHHIEEARAALTRGDTAEDRRTAMRAAGRALALDPTATAAADLVTRLMLEPPRRAPDEVEQRLEAIDTESARTQGRLGAIAMTGYLAFIPILLWTGIRDAGTVAAFAAVAVLAAAQVYAMTRRERIPQSGIYASACINAVLIALVCRIVGPFLIAPTLVLTTLMAFAVHPRFGRVGLVAAILTLGVAVPWALEAAGVIAPTYRFDGGSLVLTSPAVRFSDAPVQLAFAAVLGSLVAITAVLLRSMAARQRDATRQIELGAWHLRQLVR